MLPLFSNAPSTVGAPATAFNDADVAFAQGMIPHHEQAVEMADIALDPTVGAGSSVLDLAARIKAAQDPEIMQMSTWLSSWGQPAAMGNTDGHDMSTMDGTMTAEEMDSLATEAANGSNPEALALADQIMSAQQAEIAEMQTLLAG